VTRSPRLAAALFAALFFALHLPFLPRSLEDLDSINFALGIRDFDVAQHRPHPPGYPLYIAAAKIVNRIIRSGPQSERYALCLLSVLAGALAVFALVALFTELDRDRPHTAFTWLAVTAAAASPLFWFTSARPLSDVPGLAAALAVQALIVTARGAAPLTIAAAAAGFGAGIRSQVVWLTVPLLVWAVFRDRRILRPSSLPLIGGAYVVGVLAWLVPLILVSGGPGAYWAALWNQGAEDLTGVALLATRPSIRLLVTALQYTLLEPWTFLAAGAVVVALALAGAAERWVHARGQLLVLLVAFGPYFVFDLLYQESITTRYALPLVIPMSYLAVRGLSMLPEMGGLLAAGVLVVFCVWVDDVAMYQYSRMAAPAFRMLQDMQQLSDAAKSNDPSSPAPVLAWHRKEYFDLRRPIVWMGDRMPPIERQLAAPPKHEWLEVVKYWNSGGRAPVWFIRTPTRSDFALVKAASRPTLYRWPLEFHGLIGGVRPDVMDWYVIDRPDWYLGEGWALTPETAGTANEDRKGPGIAPITGWIRRWPQSINLVIGGRNLAPGGAPVRVRVAVDGATVDELMAPPGFFLRMLTIPAPAGTGDYAAVSVSAETADVAIEQFDAQPTGRTVFGYDTGWHEQEYNPATGELWRWSSDRATLRVRAEGHRLALTLRGTIEHASRSQVTVRAGDRVLSQFEVTPDFTRTVLLPADATAAPEILLTIESTAFYVPAERRFARTSDRRRLALKIFECSLTPAS
jgi:hypothetical protein